MKANSIKQRVVFEDNHLLILNKLPGELVQGDKTGDEPLVETAKKYLKDAYMKPGDVFLGIPHRLDRPVSGIVVFSRTSKSLTRMTEMFRDKTIQKTYWAVVGNNPPNEEGRLVDLLVRNTKKNKSFVTMNETYDAKKAELTYRLIASSDRYFLLEIDLHTGRHHQIRAQLAHMGCPIKGDLKYGYDRSNKDASIHLHARSVSFIHPVKKEELVLKADPPKDVLWDFFLENCASL